MIWSYHSQIKNLEDSNTTNVTQLLKYANLFLFIPFEITVKNLLTVVAWIMA